MIGVSPAYFISRFTDRFTPEDIIASMPDIKGMGYDGFEPEIFHADTIPSWKNGGARNVRDAARRAKLTPTQFVAHFLVKAFDTTASLASPFGLAELRSTLDIVDTFEGISTVVVPFGAFRNDGRILSPGDEKAYLSRVLEKLGAMLKDVESSGRTMALEIMPGSLIGGYAGFLEICDQLESDTLGLNLDTGHAHASGEELSKAVDLLGDRILGTHLCDNFGTENLSLAPGRAEIDFKTMVERMQAKGYKGSWDVEIICNPTELLREYTAGHQCIHHILG